MPHRLAVAWHPAIGQALELIIRYLLKPGDAALVDDPGYYNLFGNLRLNDIKMLAVPRNVDGPDLDIMEKLAAEHQPKIWFTQSVMQNPTCDDARVLRWLERIATKRSNSL